MLSQSKHTTCWQMKAKGICWVPNWAVHFSTKIPPLVGTWASSYHWPVLRLSSSPTLRSFFLLLLLVLQWSCWMVMTTWVYTEHLFLLTIVLVQVLACYKPMSWVHVIVRISLRTFDPWVFWIFSCKICALKSSNFLKRGVMILGISWIFFMSLDIYVCNIWLANMQMLSHPCILVPMKYDPARHSRSMDFLQHLICWWEVQQYRYDRYWFKYEYKKINDDTTFK